MSVYACADFHGQGNLWDQIKEFLQPGDILYFLGDAIDRGPDGYRIMLEMLNNKQVIYLKGNHELMMQEALTEARKYNEEWFGEKIDLWQWNGGYSTFEAWTAAGKNFGIIEKLKSLSVIQTYINNSEEEIYLCHAGFTPGPTKVDDYDLVWDRKHLINKCPIVPKCKIVHGHTPTEYLKQRLNQFVSTDFKYKEIDGVIIYCSGMKIDIDCGSATTGYTVLLNLDTWDIIPFIVENN